LALIELASGLTEQQLRGGAWVGDDLPIGQRLEDHFLARGRALDAKAQLFLLVAASESSGDPLLVRRAAHELGSDGSGEDVAISSGLIAMRSRFVFRHHLVRVAVYAGAPRGLRGEVHSKLAELLESTDPDRRVQHLAAAARLPDANLAFDLEEAGTRAAGRGGYAAAASFYLEAAQLSPSSTARAQRLLRAAKAAFLAGTPRRADALLKEAFSDMQDPELRAQAMLFDGTLRTPLSQPGYAPERLLAAAYALAPFDQALSRDDVGYNSFVKQAEKLARDAGALVVLQVALCGRVTAEIRSGRFGAAEMTYDEVVAITRVIGRVPEFYESLKCEVFAWRGQDQEARAAAAALRGAATAIGSALSLHIAQLAVATVDLAAGRYVEALRAIEPMLEPPGLGSTVSHSPSPSRQPVGVGPGALRLTTLRN
jgi:hypothetical protein